MAPNIFRDRTVLLLAEHIANICSFARIRDLLIDLELSSFDEIDRLMTPPRSKKELVLKILRRVNEEGDESDFYRLMQRSLEGADGELIKALQLEGWDVSEFGVTPLAGALAEPAIEESILVEKLEDRGMTEVTTLLEQSYDNYIHGHFEAANAMTRTALEALVKLIAEKIAAARSESIPQSVSGRHQPRDYRDYLKAVSFVDTDEHELLRTFYGYASPEGSHPGLSDQTDARLRRFMMIGLCLFYLEKLESWGTMSKKIVNSSS